MAIAPHPSPTGSSFERVQSLRDYYDNNDQTAELEEAVYDGEVVADAMVTTSLRLPRSLLQWVRSQAEAEQVKPTALLRRWVEERRAGSSPHGNESVGERLAVLEQRSAEFAEKLAHLEPTSPGAGGSGVTGKIDKAWKSKSIHEIADGPVEALQGVSEADARHLADAFNIRTVRDFGTNKYFLWAQSIATLSE